MWEKGTERVPVNPLIQCIQMPVSILRSLKYFNLMLYMAIMPLLLETAI